MKSVASIQIIRQPDRSLAIGADEKALSILPSAESALSVSENPLALVMKPSQVIKYGIQGWPYKSEDFSITFDTVHNRLKSLVESKDFGGVLKIADELIPQIPVCKNQNHQEIQNKSYQLFVHSKENLSTGRIEEFFKSIKELDLEQYASSILTRIDALKSEVLVKKVLGTLGDKDEKALGNLRAQIGLAALLTERKANSKKKNSTFSFTKRMMKAPIMLPSFAFGTNRCDAESDPASISNTSLTDSPLGLRHSKQVISAKSSSKEKEGDKCQCDCGNPECKPSDKCCVDIKYYITDLLELREETHCYEASDLAYIENIAPLETRKRSHTFRKEIVDYEEEETTETRTEERDHQVTDRSSVQKEVEKQISASLDVDSKVTGGTYTVDTSASLSRDTAQREAREKFREMVTKAVQKIQTQTRKLRTRQVTTESSETNVHNFVNETADHQVAKYFYVSQIKKGQVFSHGTRLMLEIFIPSPAANYLALEQKKAEGAFDLDEPDKPDLSPSDFVPKNFPNWNEKDKNYQSLWEHVMQKYGVTDLSKPPPDEKPERSSLPINALTPKGGERQITIPEGYRAKDMFISKGGSHIDNKWGYKDKARMGLWYNNKTAELNYQGEKKEPVAINKNGPVTIKIGVVAFHVKDNSKIAGYITLEPIKYDYSEWQQEAHRAVIEKYEVDLAEYNRLLEEFKMKFKEERKLMHPFTAEEHMRTQIKQSAIFMMCDNLDENVMNMKTKPCGLPTFFRKASQEATSRWYFFDRAFDWKLSEFIFFDYFRNPICKWEETFDPNEPNFLFKSFLRAGYARLQLPVSPGMEADVMTYLQDGTFWNGDEFPPGDPNDDRYISVVSELKHSYGCRQNDRPGNVEATNGNDYVIVRNSEFYWDPGANSGSGQVDQTLMELDENREIFIDGIQYRIIKVEHVSVNSLGGQDWKIYIERPFEGATVPSGNYKHSIGAKHIGDPFFFELPTDLVWLGDMQKDDGSPNKCLPCDFPVKC